MNTTGSTSEELLSEFAEATDEAAEKTGRMFSDLLDEVREEEAERDLPGNDEDTQLYVLFETNHLDLKLPEEGVTRMNVSRLGTCIW